MHVSEHPAPRRRTSMSPVRHYASTSFPFDLIALKAAPSTESARYVCRITRSREMKTVWDLVTLEGETNDPTQSDFPEDRNIIQA